MFLIISIVKQPRIESQLLPLQENAMSKSLIHLCYVYIQLNRLILVFLAAFRCKSSRRYDKCNFVPGLTYSVETGGVE
jgi:hypothetical protein